MNAWRVLGIARTADRAVIRRAYAALLKQTNPEDDADGFKALRAAYESALAHADHIARWGDYEEDEEDEGGVGDALATVDRDDTPAAPPAPDIDPELAALLAEREADRAALRTAQDAMETGLNGPWRPDDAGLEARLQAILTAPALDEIGLRDGVERWLAGLLAATIPHSDAVLVQAVEAFGWDDERRDYDPDIAALTERLEEWRIIAALNQPSHPHHRGWRALTRPPASGWRWRLETLRPGVAHSVATLLDDFDAISPGIQYSFNADAVAKWRAFLHAPHLSLGLLAIGPALAAAVIGIFFVELGMAIGWPQIAAATVAGGLAPIVTLKLLAPRRIAWAARYDHPRWVADGWLAAYAATALLALPLPGAWPAVVLAPALGVLAWAYVVKPERQATDGGYWPLILIAFGAFAAASTPAVRGAESCAMAIVSALYLYLRYTRWGEVRAILDDVLGEAADWKIFGVTVLGMAALVATLVLRAPAPPLYPTALIALALLPLVQAPSASAGWPRRMALVGVWLAFWFSALNTLPDPSAQRPGAVSIDARGAATVDDAMAAMGREQPGFALLKAGDPMLYAVIREKVQHHYDGKITRAEALDQVNAVIDQAYRQRLPMADGGLLIDGLDIRLAVLRELKTSDPAACAGKSGHPITPDALPETLSKRRNAQVFNVLSNPPVPREQRDTTKRVDSLAVSHTAATALGLTPDRYATALAGKSGDGNTCAALIATLEAMRATSDRDALIATLRENHARAAEAWHRRKTPPAAPPGPTA